MSHMHCSTCGKLRRDHFDHRLDHHNGHGHHHGHDHHHGHHHGHDNFDHHGCHDFHHRDFICDRFLCDDDFRLRLGGLQGNLNFRLRQLIGCKVKFELEGDDKIIAKVCFVGSDFVEVEVLDDKKDDKEEKPQVEKKKKIKKKVKCPKVLIFRMDAIKYMELKDDCKEDIKCDCCH
ncbi:hypothetical protein IM538_05645 [Cytobacillus suaedae]|nr:hypothetical protein IM538_05645 [Cytobacillus suaedae]